MQDEILDQDPDSVEYKATFKTRPLIIWFLVLAIGFTFRILHWPFGSVLIVSSSAGLQAYSLNGFIRSKERNKLNTVLCLLGFIWILVILWGVLFNNGYPYNEIALEIYFIVLIPYFLIYYLISQRKNRKAIKTEIL